MFTCFVFVFLKHEATRKSEITNVSLIICLLDSTAPASCVWKESYRVKRLWGFSTHASNPWLAAMAIGSPALGLSEAMGVGS